MAGESSGAEIRVTSIVFSQAVGFNNLQSARLSWKWTQAGQDLEDEYMEIPIRIPRYTHDSAEWLKMLLGEILLSL